MVTTLLGGAIFTQSQSSIVIVNSTFINNTANANLIVYGSGSALYDYRGHVDIHACIFSSNVASGSGGALYFYVSAARVTSCSFRNNSALYGGVQRGIRSTIHYGNSVFSFNLADLWGGVMDNQKGSNIDINSCHFERNSVLLYEGGAIRTWLDNIVTIADTTFFFNTAVSDSGGALSGLISNFALFSCYFIGNSASNYGGALYTIGLNTDLKI